ncbi:MAG: hypothetical protein KME60_31975 [Cyanomargarita calcarea GSE-NOS-MK-12-04C]|uniref:Uncharacterized protein n=1 Tax=Cyanomargarita calcarea GSE-NOS-MK-12-04C TaxID=2839659 RepID=A0A951UVV9_9CYAN|nr:hypothetical protein [Cyanomargarita calcarea GSE-NOS-MK-12-04C]
MCDRFLADFSYANRTLSISVLIISTQSSTKALSEMLAQTSTSANYDTANVVILPTFYIGKNLLTLG